MERIETNGFIEDAELLAEAVVDTIHESLLLLGADLRVKMANRSFSVNLVCVRMKPEAVSSMNSETVSGTFPN
jgi:pyridoxal biosynthesis lyase PdxS